MSSVSCSRIDQLQVNCNAKKPPYSLQVAESNRYKSVQLADEGGTKFQLNVRRVRNWQTAAGAQKSPKAICLYMLCNAKPAQGIPFLRTMALHHKGSANTQHILLLQNCM
jgi:hypothetical protein